MLYDKALLVKTPVGLFHFENDRSGSYFSVTQPKSRIHGRENGTKKQKRFAVFNLSTNIFH